MYFFYVFMHQIIFFANQEENTMLISKEDIFSYINFLITKQKLYVSVHGKIAEFEEFSKYNIHTHSLCAHTKRNHRSKCVKQQAEFIANSDKESFFAICHAGIGEFIYLLKDINKKTIGFISVSGYQTGDSSSKNPFLSSLYHIPDKYEIDTLIRPLVFLCEAYYDANKSSVMSTTIMDTIIHYINVNYAEEITIKSLSKKFNYSPSAISHQFKKKTNMSLREYIENIRIDHAKYLLQQFDIPITEIAFLLGFCNGGYFSMIFKKKTGFTPKQYRKKSTAFSKSNQ